MKKLIKITKAGTGLIAEYIGDNGEKRRDYLADVYGSIVPPESIFPGFYLFLGIMWDTTPAGPNKILFLAEGENHIRATLIQEMHNTAVRVSASNVYADNANKGFFASIWNLPLKYYLMPAPSVRNADYGMGLLKEIIISNAIDWPNDSIACQKIMDMDEGADLKALQFYPFHAMRFILGAIERDLNLSNADYAKQHDIVARRFHKPGNRRSLEQTQASGAVL